MPLMAKWTEIHVDEDLLIPVVRELLDMAVSPNHVEVVYGVTGRVILAEVHLAEHWYQERQKRDTEENLSVEDFFVVASSDLTAEPEVAAQSNVPTEDTVQASIVEPEPVVEPAVDEPPLIKRGPGRPRKELPPSASPDGEDS